LGLSAFLVMAALGTPVAAGDGAELGLRLAHEGLLWKVVRITPNGGAAKAGLHVGDVIVQVNSLHFPSEEQLRQVASGLKQGDVLTVTILGPGGQAKFELKAEARSGE
jgi:S1-C subfamily serine protease